MKFAISRKDSSSPFPHPVVRTRPTPDRIIARTGPSPSEAIVVRSEPSDRIEFLNDRQLIAALAGRPVMLAEIGNGERRLYFLDERDRQLIRDP